MEIKLSSVTQSALEKAAKIQRKTAEQLVEELLTRRYQTGVTDTGHALLYDTSVDGWGGRFDSQEGRADMVVNIRMSDTAGIAITNAARKAGTTPEALVLRLVEREYGGKQDADDPKLRARVHLDLLRTQESVAREGYIERLRSSSRR